MKSLLSVIFLVLFAVTLAACGAAQESVEPTPPPAVSEPETVSTPSSETSQPGGYPAPVEDSGYPAPLTLEETLPDTMQPVPAPASSEVGVVTGVIKSIQDDAGLKPTSGIILYLGKVVYLADGTPAMASLDRSSPLKAQTSLVGQFIIEDVPPGQYTLLFDLITQTFLLNDPDTGSDLIIEVNPGQVVDLGEMEYVDLPLPGN